MGALGRVLIRATVSEPAAFEDYWYRGRGSGSDGAEIGTEQLLTLPAFYAGVSLIAETIATIPLGIYQAYEVNGQDAHRRARNHPLDEVLYARPNNYQTAVEWREMMTAFAIMRDYGLSEIKPGPRGAVDQLIPLHPDLLTRKVLKDGSRVYDYRDPRRSFEVRRLLDDEVFVINSRMGRGLVEFARNSISGSLAQQRYDGLFFSRAARPQGALKYPGKLAPEARTNLRAALDEYAISGQYSGKPLLLEDGMEWQQVGMNADDAQKVESQLLSLQDAARWLNMSPIMLGDLSHGTYSNVEQLLTAFVTITMRPWTVRWEQSISFHLISAPQIYYAKHKLDALNRGDLLTRMQAYEIMLRSRIKTRNEIRGLEDDNPVSGGDDFDVFPATGANPPPKQVAAEANYTRLLVRDAAARVVRKETAAIAKLDPASSMWPIGVGAFYAEHGDFVGRLLRLEPVVASDYAEKQSARVLAAGKLDDELDRIDDLTDLALFRLQSEVTP